MTLSSSSENVHILITNDDGLKSPGLLAAIRAALPHGTVTVAAPLGQQTGAGRSFRAMPDRQVYRQTLAVDGHTVAAFGLHATPAQVVNYALTDFLPQPPDLVVSGINFGENVGSGITISGTVGAALEAASLDTPALAVSLETSIEQHLSYSPDVNFDAATLITRQIIGHALQSLPWPLDMDVLKIDIPASATPETPRRLTRVSRQAYHYSIPSPVDRRGQEVQPGYEARINPETLEPDSDIYALCVDRVVSMTPISLDLSARVQLTALGDAFHGATD